MLLDTASMYFRAFFGVPEITAPDGTPVNAVRGFWTSSPGWSSEYRPRATWSAAGTTTGARSGGSTCCRRTRRTAWWRGARRPRTSRRSPTRSRCRSRSSSRCSTPSGSACVGADGYEADDVIGTLATERRPAGRHRHRRPRPVPARRRRGRRAGALHRPRRRQPRAGRPTTGCARSTASTRASTPTSRPCAATPPTACPAWPASARRPPRRCSRRFGDMAGIIAAAAGPRLRHGPRPARQDQGGRRLPGGGPDRWSPSPATSTSTAAASSCPVTPRDPDGGRRPRPAVRPREPGGPPGARRSPADRTLVRWRMSRSPSSGATARWPVTSSSRCARSGHDAGGAGPPRGVPRGARDARRRGAAARHRAARTPTRFAAAFAGCDAVVFAAGGGPDGNMERKRTVDLEGSLKSDRGRTQAGITRFVQVSAIGVDDAAAATTPARCGGPTSRPSATPTRRCATAAWPGRSSGPGGSPTTRPPGWSRSAPTCARGDIPRADVAAVLAAVLDQAATVGQQWNLVTGDTPVAGRPSATRLARRRASDE